MMVSGLFFGNNSATNSFDVMVVAMVEIATRSPGNKSKPVVKLKRY